MNSENSDLNTKLSRLDWDKELSALDREKVLDYIRSKLAGVEVVDSFIGSAGTYSSISWLLQVVVRTPKVFYEFLFDPSMFRYDISLSKDIYRVEERIETEESVDGPPRTRTTLNIQFQSPTALTAVLREYGIRGREVSAFGDRLIRSLSGE